MIWPRWLLAAAATTALIAVAACADDRGRDPSSGRSEQVTGASDPAMLTVTEALEAPAGSTVSVRGYVIATAGATYLAEMLAESYPPQPGGSLIQLEGLDVDTLRGTEQAGDTTWTADQRVISGRIQGDVLDVR